MNKLAFHERPKAVASRPLGQCTEQQEAVATNSIVQHIISSFLLTNIVPLPFALDGEEGDELVKGFLRVVHGPCVSVWPRLGLLAF